LLNSVSMSKFRFERALGVVAGVALCFGVVFIGEEEGDGEGDCAGDGGEDQELL